MPAANSIANQDRSENSGLAPSPPMRILLTGSTISARQKRTKMLAATMNSQSKYSIDQALAPSKAALAGPGAIRVPMTKISTRMAAIQNTGW